MRTEVCCRVCGAIQALSDCETARIRSNVRAFRAESFELWRCPKCRSIHTLEPVELAKYYAAYPSFAADVEPRLRGAYENLLKRLTAAGLRPRQRILDYGCGSGALVRFLRARGYDAEGYDAYNPSFAGRAVLERRYDCVVSQDVIEHVDSPPELLRELDRLVVPAGLIAIGTPDAAAIDLARPEDYVHTLHAPYHLHILTSDALRELAEAQGWKVERYYPTMYGNTLIPGENPRLGLHYLRCHDDTLDLLTEPLKWSWRMLSPATAFYFFFGYFFDRHTDIMFTFRRPG